MVLHDVVLSARAWAPAGKLPHGAARLLAAAVRELNWAGYQDGGKLERALAMINDGDFRVESECIITWILQCVEAPIANLRCDCAFSLAELVCDGFGGPVHPGEINYISTGPSERLGLPVDPTDYTSQAFAQLRTLPCNGGEGRNNGRNQCSRRPVAKRPRLNNTLRT